MTEKIEIGQNLSVALVLIALFLGILLISIKSFDYEQSKPLLLRCMNSCYNQYDNTMIFTCKQSCINALAINNTAIPFNGTGWKAE